MDPALEGQVEIGRHVGREDDDALVIFQLPQEHGHDGVAHQVVVGPLGQEDVRLVQQDNRVPVLAELED